MSFESKLLLKGSLDEWPVVCYINSLSYLLRYKGKKKKNENVENDIDPKIFFRCLLTASHHLTFQVIHSDLILIINSLHSTNNPPITHPPQQLSTLTFVGAWPCWWCFYLRSVMFVTCTMWINIQSQINQARMCTR